MTETGTFTPPPVESTTIDSAAEGLAQTKEELLENLQLSRKEISIEELTDILGTDIKFDDNTKAVLFLLTLLNYTDKDQQNVNMTGPPSQGKTWTVTRILWYFPNEDQEPNAGATPRSFHYNDRRKQMVLANDDLKNPVFEEIDFSLKPDKEASETEKQEWRDYKRKFCFVTDYERKIVVFVDVPNYQLMENIRSSLSHDMKYSRYLAVNVNRKTEANYIKGFFTCIVCTASTYQKDEERDRFWHLNPEWNEKKEKAVLDLIDKANSEPDYQRSLEENPGRIALKCRVFNVKDAHINNVFIPPVLIEQIRNWFNERYAAHVPKKSRDYPRFYGLVKACALLNFNNRKIEETNGQKIVWCSQTDLDNAFKLYEPLVKSNELGISPEAYDMLKTVIEPLLTARIIEGGTYKDFQKEYRVKYNRIIGERLRGFLQTFVQRGLIDERRMAGNQPTLYYLIPKESDPPHFTFKKLGVVRTEGCGQCGLLAVEYEVTKTNTGETFRKCEQCYNNMREKYKAAKWKELVP